MSRPPGEVRDAIIRALDELGGEASVSDIYENVNRQLSGKVAPSSVRSYLALEEGNRFQRTKRGRYRLRRR